MVQEDLINSMETTAEERKSEIVALAMRQAAEIKDDAAAKAAEIKARRMAEAARTAEAERNRSVYEAGKNLTIGMTKLRQELFDMAFAGAGNELAAVRGTDDYAVCYRQLVREALVALDHRDTVLHIDPQDRDLCFMALEEQGVSYEVLADLTCAGGLNASTKDGMVVIYNTIEARLERAKTRLKLEIFSTLRGD